MLRSLDGDDAAEILRHMILTSDETENMRRYPDEITITEAEERAFLEQIADSGDAILIAAVVGGRIVANAGLLPVSTSEKCRHRAGFGISIQREYWNRGLGSLLTAVVLDAARQMGYEQVELDVVAENDRAIGLYERFGFRVFGKNERAFRTRDGRYQAVLLMACAL